MDIELRKIDLAKVTGIKSRTILDWTQRGYLVPAQKATGQGKISYYSPSNAVQVKIVKALSGIGMQPGKLFDLLNKMCPDIFDPLQNTDKFILINDFNINVDIKIEINVKGIKEDIANKLSKRKGNNEFSPNT